MESHLERFFRESQKGVSLRAVGSGETHGRKTRSGPLPGGNLPLAIDRSAETHKTRLSLGGVTSGKSEIKDGCAGRNAKMGRQSWLALANGDDSKNICAFKRESHFREFNQVPARIKEKDQSNKSFSHQILNIKQ